MNVLTDGICFNGGTQFNRSKCQCPKLFRGPRCEEIICVNGGSPLANYTCVCPDDIHYRGRHCEVLLCSNSGTAIDGRCLCPSTHTGAFCDTRSYLWAAIVGSLAVAVLCVVGCWIYCNWLAHRETEEDDDFLPWEEMSYSQRISRRLATMRRSIRSAAYSPQASPVPEQRTLQSPPSYEELEEAIDAETSHPPPTYDDAISMRSKTSLGSVSAGNRNSVGSLVSKASTAIYLSTRDLRDDAISEHDDDSDVEHTQGESSGDRIKRSEESVCDEETASLTSAKSEGAVAALGPQSTISDGRADRVVKSEGSIADAPLYLQRSFEVDALDLGSSDREVIYPVVTVDNGARRDSMRKSARNRSLKRQDHFRRNTNSSGDQPSVEEGTASEKKPSKMSDEANPDGQLNQGTSQATENDAETTQTTKMETEERREAGNVRQPDDGGGKREKTKSCKETSI